MSKQLMSSLKNSALGPVKLVKPRYIPLLMIYFAYGLSGFSSIALSFWQKEQLGLSAEQLLAIGAWAMIPWTSKIIVGQFVDSIKILGSRRRIYIFIGAILMSLGTLTLVGLAGRYEWVMWLGDEYRIYLISALLTAIGFMVQDVTADTMSTEVIERSETIDGKQQARDPGLIQAELAAVQVLGRVFFYAALLLTAGLGGWLAKHYSYETVFWLQLGIPIISCMGALLVRLTPVDENQIQPINPIIIGGGILFLLSSIIIGGLELKYAQEIIFVISLCLLSSLLWMLISKLDPTVRRTLIFTLIAIFLYRAKPSVGPGLNWWAIDVLKFDQLFFGVLAQIGAFTGLIVLWLLSDLITKRAIKTTLMILIVIETFLFLPDLLLYHGVHEQLGISAQTMAIFDAAAESPLVNVSMVLVLSLIAFYAPAGNRGTWFAIAASMTNLALTAGTLVSKYLNKLFVITREVKDEAGNIITQADYSQLGVLIICVMVITFIVPMLAVLGLLKQPAKTNT